MFGSENSATENNSKHTNRPSNSVIIQKSMPTQLLKKTHTHTKQILYRFVWTHVSYMDSFYLSCFTSGVAKTSKAVEDAVGHSASWDSLPWELHLRCLGLGALGVVGKPPWYPADGRIPVAPWQLQNEDPAGWRRPARAGIEAKWWCRHLPSGNLTLCHRKSPFLVM